MKNTYNVAVIVGSLRKASLSRKIAHALAPEQLSLDLVEIGQLPHYNQDFDENPPAVFVDFRERIKSADAVLFVTPEYNRSVPGVLKNVGCRLTSLRRQRVGRQTRRGRQHFH